MGVIWAGDLGELSDWLDTDFVRVAEEHADRAILNRGTITGSVDFEFFLPAFAHALGGIVKVSREGTVVFVGLSALGIFENAVQGSAFLMDADAS